MNPDIFIYAAECLDEGLHLYACAALNAVGGRDLSPEMRLFVDLFMPEDCNVHQGWFGDPLSVENLGWRIYSLLLCAAIAEDEANT